MTPPRLVDHPAPEPPGNPRLGWGLAPGFAGNPHWLFTLSREPGWRHPRSATAALAHDHLTTVIPPPMGGWTAYAPEFLAHLARTADAAILVGLSHGGAFMNRVYRVWRATPPATRRPRHLGLVLWSVPPAPGQLRAAAWLGLQTAVHLPRWSVSSSPLRASFIRPLERRRARRHPGLGPDVLEQWKDSVNTSAAWWHTALTEVALTNGLGPQLDPEGSVVALNVPPRTDDAIKVKPALAAIRRSYPGAPNFEVAAATRHAIPEHDGPLYAAALADIRTYMLHNWKLSPASQSKL